MKKSERLQMIIMLLHQRGRISAKDIANYMEVTQRTIYRDIDALSQMKVPIVAYEGVGGGYEIQPSYFMPTISLTDREVLILMLLLKVTNQLSLPDFNDSINALSLKLRNSCKDLAIKNEAILKQVSLEIQDIFPEAHLKGLFEVILNAFYNKNQLQIKYYVPMKNDIVDRKISPLRLLYSEGCWYLIAFCHLREEKRTFRLDRIRSVSTLKDKIALSIQKKYSSMALEDPKILLEFDIHKDLFSLIKDDGAMQGAVISNTKENLFTITIETNNLFYFETLAIRNVSQVTIKQPTPFIEQIKEKISTAAKKYF
ncbi:helix-turn-helix transcriptional regulator [Alkaliphilus serpentinus]|uniref:WYL domain-containing protein n=1 Tax=Alkaliphilus serpentinus TaxID=1482731 RepID=A0A833MDH3_9FIRM|nr:WYL domain-containing protein [Alkaliphilus serpentinus]KAB3528951.1 WYL domain-containing protein [Alkaliphilus serpentinus]